MNITRASLVIFSLLATPALAEVAVNPAQVRSGYFQADDCSPTADPKVYNECVCEANIKKAEVTGLTPDILTPINERLAMLPVRLAEESCEGKPTTAPAGLKVNKASADYKVAYQTDTTLTVLITYSTYGVGAEHPLEGTEGYTFDLASGNLVDPIARLKPGELEKADSYVKQELQKKYPAELYEETKTRTEPYLSTSGCDTCTLFYSKNGWVVRFQITAIAPYTVGEPEVVIPAEIIAPPEQLITKS